MLLEGLRRSLRPPGWVREGLIQPGVFGQPIVLSLDRTVHDGTSEQFRLLDSARAPQHFHAGPVASG